MKSKKKKEAKNAKSKEIDFRLRGHKSIERSQIAEMKLFFKKQEEDLKVFISKMNEVAKHSESSNEQIESDHSYKSMDKFNDTLPEGGSSESEEEK